MKQLSLLTFHVKMLKMEELLGIKHKKELPILINFVHSFQFEYQRMLHSVRFIESIDSYIEEESGQLRFNFVHRLTRKEILKRSQDFYHSRAKARSGKGKKRCTGRSARMSSSGQNW